MSAAVSDNIASLKTPILRMVAQAYNMRNNILDPEIDPGARKSEACGFNHDVLGELLLDAQVAIDEFPALQDR
jgi:hypothetical protein